MIASLSLYYVPSLTVLPASHSQPPLHSIEEAADGQIAVDKVKQEADAGRHYDVILMDFVMPVMDGPTATRAIRAMHITSPIFGLTGNLSLHQSVLLTILSICLCINLPT